MNCIQRLIKTRELADTHAHLDFEILADNLDTVLRRAEESGLKEIWLMSVDATSAIVNAKLIAKARATKYQVRLRLAAGIDMELLVPGSELFAAHIFAYSPEQLRSYLESEWQKLLAELDRLGVEPELIGEVGMDGYWLEKGTTDGLLTAADMKHSLGLQREMFRFFLEQADKLDLPLSIHSRGCEEECLQVALEHGAREGEGEVDGHRQVSEDTSELRGIFHSYTGDLRLLDQIRQAGFMIGVNGIATYKSGAHIMQRVRRDIAKLTAATLAEVPAENRLELLYQAGYVLETDAPYLVPARSNRKLLKKSYGQTVNDPAEVERILAQVYGI